MIDSASISNFEIQRIIWNSNNDFINNFLDVFSSEKMNKFIDSNSLMKEKANTKCPFLISNTDRAGITAIHWWSILNIHPKFEFFMVLLELMD